MRRTVCSVAVIALAAAFGFAATNISEEKYRAIERRHWSFQPRSQPAIPTFTTPRDKAWVRNPIDALILDRLKKEGLPHAPLASKQTLIRRVYYDLTRLPPTPA